MSATEEQYGPEDAHPEEEQLSEEDLEDAAGGSPEFPGSSTGPTYPGNPEDDDGDGIVDFDDFSPQ